MKQTESPAIRAIQEIKKAVIGKDDCIIKVMTAILAGGHILIEDVPGVGKTTLALAFVMMMNYLAILLYPFIVDFLQKLFHTQSQEFPFIFNLLITVVTFFWAYLRRDSFLFNDQLK